MPRNFSRPNLPYINISLPNDKRYQLLTRSNKRPPTDIMIDSDFDYVIDALNILDVAMDGISLGELPGVDVPDNANKLLTTDGAGNASWVFVQASNILDQSITGNKLFPQTITAIQLADGGIPASKIAPNAITTIKILDENITFPKMAANSVGTINLLDANVTLEKMADDSVDTPNLVDDCVTTPKILDANVTTPKIADANITTPKILDANVTTPKIADGAITLPKIGAGVLTSPASKADQIAAVSNTVYTNPLVQQHHPSAAKFWCKFDGTLTGTNPPIAGYNVTSVTRVGVGNYIINYTVPFSSNNYSIGGSSINIPSYYLYIGIISQNQSNGNIFVAAPTGPGSALADSPLVNCIGFGLQ
jgi:hypothetical protein